MDHLFEDWFANDIKPRLKHPNIPARLYRKEMKPVIGDIRIEQVTARDAREVLQRVKLSGRPSNANDVLMYMKQLFRHAVQLDLTLNNPTAAFGENDAGGIEKSGDRAFFRFRVCIACTKRFNKAIYRFRYNKSCYQ